MTISQFDIPHVYAAMVLVVVLAFWLDARYRPRVGGRSGVLGGLALTAALLGFFLAQYRNDWLSETVHYGVVVAIAVLALIEGQIGRVAKIYMALSFPGVVVVAWYGFSLVFVLSVPLLVFAFFLGAKVSRELESKECS